MEKVIAKKKCVGCTSCSNVCPKNAITMVKGQDGFLYPKIDQNLCVDCKLCLKSCPVINFNTNISMNKCYVGYNKLNNFDNKSSSGGIFGLLANQILLDDGVVIGAILENNKLKHIAISNIDDLDKMKGSKYLQSDLGNVFTFVKSNVSKKKILFVGTPCQVAGLKAYLKKDYENLFTIDLICHGVPSPLLFEKYIKELEDKYNTAVINYNFRDKQTGWDTYSNTVEFSNFNISNLYNENDYMKLFLCDVALRESCYDCKFKIGNKYSDITLGDFWGVKEYYPEMYNKNGVSAIVINTEKGGNLFESCKSNISFKPCNLNEIINGNPSLKCSSKPLKSRKKFFRDINNYSVTELVNTYTNLTLIDRLKRKKRNIIRKVKNEISN